MNNDKPYTEDQAIAALKRVAKRWPKSLWLYSAAGGLHVMGTDQNGEKVTTSDGGFDSDYLFDTIDILNDGGDW